VVAQRRGPAKGPARQGRGIHAIIQLDAGAFRGAARTNRPRQLRAAALVRGKRMGLVTPARPDNLSMLVPWGPQRLRKLRPKRLKRSAEVSAAMLERGADEAGSPAPAVEHPVPAKLRCVGIRPRRVSLVELEADDCRYPYGGDKEG
jgi:GcrA cell cycle regulator